MWTKYIVLKKDPMLCHIIIWSCNHFIDLEKDIELYCKKYGNECKFILSSCDLNKHKYVMVKFKYR